MYNLTNSYLYLFQPIYDHDIVSLFLFYLLSNVIHHILLGYLLALFSKYSTLMLLDE